MVLLISNVSENSWVLQNFPEPCCTFYDAVRADALHRIWFYIYIRGAIICKSLPTSYMQRLYGCALHSVFQLIITLYKGKAWQFLLRTV